MARRFIAAFIGLLLPVIARAQDQATPTLDTIIVEGNHRVATGQVIGTAGLVIHSSISYRDIQRAVTALYKTGQFDNVEILQRSDSGKTLVIQITERPVMERWSVVGASRLSESSVKERIKLTNGRPLDRAALARSKGAVDSVYRAQGYYEARVEVQQLPQDNGNVRVVFLIHEGKRVAVSQVTVDGNAAFRDQKLVDHMATRPEGFWWFQNGRLDDDRLSQDLRERLPLFYSENGYIDFQVTHDSLAVDSVSGKASLDLAVIEGNVYRVGSFDVVGNRRFSTEEISTLYPFGNSVLADSLGQEHPVFNRTQWDKATESIKTLYNNNGYIYAAVNPQETRRATADGRNFIDLRWNIQEGPPATINKIEILGNDVTHERVIREAIVMLPGELFNRDKLIRSYQNISNLGFFQQPMAGPDVQPTSNGVDVNIVFRVQEKRTGNINFGASLGQGTGLGGFLGLQEPNLFGRGKRGSLQWQFGSNINDFTLSYTDPAINESRVSGTVSLFDSRQRFTIGDLGRRRQRGFSLQAGFPFFADRYTRIFTTYGLQKISYEGGSTELQQQFICSGCTRSTLGASLVRDTRIDLPFPTAGQQATISGEYNGGFLGGSGNYFKADLDGRWYTPLGVIGGNSQLGSGIRMVLGLTAKSGFIFGDAGPFYTELYSMGGTQYGIPLRGYNEFSITPDGFDPTASGNNAAGVNSFGKAYASFSVEIGARLSQSLYFDTFMDAGNVYRTARQYDPSRLFKGAGVGAAIVSPLGPIGLDLAYGFDRTDTFGKPKPGWKLHFRLGNFF
ncbi:MAG: outer membrane protein assembly factor BamA [Gemmatimonadota bacterium]